MAGLSEFSADDIISSDDLNVNPNITIAGPGSASVLGSAANAETPAQASLSSEEVQNQLPEELPLDSAAIEKMLSAKVPAAPVEPDPEEVKPEVVAAEADEKPKTKKLSPSQERIIALIAERNEARAESARIAQQVAAIQQQQATQQAQFQQQQLALEQRRVAIMEQARREEEEAKLSDVEKARRQFLRDSKDEALREIAPEIAELKAWKAQAEAREVAAQEAAAQAERDKHFQGQAKAVLDKYLLKDFTPDEQKNLGSGMEEMLYSFSGAFGVDPVRAAPVFKALLNNYVKAENARLSRVSGTKVAASRAAPKPVPAARPGGTPAAKSMPTLAQLRVGDGRRSFDNHVQWMGAGMPALLP
jgi:hypothetical protein